MALSHVGAPSTGWQGVLTGEDISDVLITLQMIRLFVKVSFIKVSFWEILLIFELDININKDDTSEFFFCNLQVVFKLYDIFDSCRRCKLRYIYDLNIIHHYLYKNALVSAIKCTIYGKKNPFQIDLLLLLYWSSQLAVKQLCKFEFNKLQMTFRALFAHARFKIYISDFSKFTSKRKHKDKTLCLVAPFDLMFSQHHCCRLE